ncbi:MAG: hypothetical protein A2571_01335 [Candidatus Vogelbacteria bacterium RIFOXYD1_FULL_44_32]|uniref:Glycosyl transferase family 1 domain-containing protein n=1 Tax=Candidatus Vogelbacteria bacterium RIFOXYD1_FULL_44_32 TaxID=1802438 RepID=A0A1G2QCU3_9BACT|nr:MAG: hypothetical protein A2571_01335 [Candidatus Vogelbacteria bacterium RIFOXYD1_FULL_44_32]
MVSNRPKILIFSTAYLPLIGGAEIAIKEITDRWPDCDFDLVTAKLRPGLPSLEKIGAVTVYRLGFGWSLDKFWLAVVGAAFASKLHRQNNYDVVWAMMASFGGLAAVLFKQKFPAVKYLLSLQEGDELSRPTKKAFLIKKWWSNIFKLADIIQVISSYLAEWAKTENPSAKVMVIPNGVDLAGYNFRPKTWSLGAKKLVTTSRLAHKNGLDLVIKALPLLPADITFHIAGMGEEENKLRGLATKLGVADRVIFHGLVARENLPSFLMAGDIFIRPSRSEGLGNSFLEAMAVGLPIVAPLVGGITDFLVDKETGFVIKPESPASIAEVVKYVLEEENKTEVLGVTQTARELVVDRFDWTKISQQFRELFESII